MRLLLLPLLLGGCVTAKHPPARFDHPAHARVIYAGQAEALRRCGPPAAMRITTSVACAFPAERPCLIIIGPDPLPGTLRHEEAHCNGWGAAHEP
jgi:hypothetical protein